MLLWHITAVVSGTAVASYLLLFQMVLDAILLSTKPLLYVI